MVNKNVKGGIAGPVGGGGCSCGRGCSHSELEIETRDELDSHSGCKGRDESRGFFNTRISSSISCRVS